MLAKLFTALLAACVLLPTPPAVAGETDPSPPWPLCGRIGANPPQGWNETQGCPSSRFGNAAHADLPFSSSFGPRPLYSGDDRYDFHRGMDLAAPIGTPIFAISDGLVQIAGVDSGYTDPVIKIRHFRPGRTSCATVGCYYSLYLHVNDWVVAAGTNVTKGQLIGHTGASSASNFAHLHFEVRDAPANDVNSAWSRDAVHPLRVLPYDAPNDTVVAFGTVDTSNANATTASVTVDSNRYDLDAVEVRVFDANHVEIPQPGSTPDARGYYVLPPFFDLELQNFQYSHKDSTAFPWSSYGVGGANECPYALDHGASYDENVHMDRPWPADYHDGLFNGIHVGTKKYWPSDVGRYWLRTEFLALRGPAACLEATARFASGDTATSEWGQCRPNQAPTAVIASSCTNLSCNYSGSGSSDPDGTIAGYAWTYGDGGTGTGASTSHAYAAAGTYTVGLTVTDNQGATASTSRSITVQAPAPAISASVSANGKRNQITVAWTGATGTKVDIRRNGALLVNTKNTGSYNDRAVVKGNRYAYKVCQPGSTTACSNEAVIDL